MPVPSESHLKLLSAELVVWEVEVWSENIEEIEDARELRRGRQVETRRAVRRRPGTSTGALGGARGGAHAAELGPQASGVTREARGTPERGRTSEDAACKA